MKILILILLGSICQAQGKPYACVGKSISNWLNPPKGVYLNIKNNILTIGYRYSNKETCMQIAEFNESGIITNFSEKGICGSKLPIVPFFY